MIRLRYHEIFSGRQHQQPCQYTLVQIVWKKPHHIVTLSFSEVFFQVEGQAKCRSTILARRPCSFWILSYYQFPKKPKAMFVFRKLVLPAEVSSSSNIGGLVAVLVTGFGKATNFPSLPNHLEEDSWRTSCSFRIRCSNLFWFLFDLDSVGVTPMNIPSSWRNLGCWSFPNLLAIEKVNI